MYSKETSSPQDYIDFFLLFSFKSLAVLGFTFRSVIHFELFLCMVCVKG